ncbi:hypothetical protein ACLB2K_013624 [Fragaria x ananassa]
MLTSSSVTSSFSFFVNNASVNLDENVSANENSVSTNETSANSDSSANNSDNNTHFWSNNGLQSNVTVVSLVDGTEVINGGDNPSSLPYELSFVEDPNQAYNNHSMLTRAKNGIIKKKSFEDYCAFSCIVQQENFDELAFFSGFSYVMHLSDLIEPSSFKSATGKPEWDDAMNEEISALKNKVHENWFLYLKIKILLAASTGSLSSSCATS